MFFLIGHRGVGKTSLASEIEGSVDLDFEISRSHSIGTYFKENDEAGFRSLEKQVLQRILLEKKTKLVVLGAGFDFRDFCFPKESTFIWIQRRSDLKGRTFVDRPRLDSSLEPLEEYFSRFERRQQTYRVQSSFSIELIEGAPSHLAVSLLKKFMSGDKIQSAQAYYTIESEDDLKFVSGCLELRTDLLSEMQIESIIESYTKNSYMVSMRTQTSKLFLDKVLMNKNVLLDLPFENQGFAFDFSRTQTQRENIFLSCHGELTSADLELIKKHKLHLKWAPEVQSFEDLKSALSLIANKDVSFLPRDPDGLGRWKWVRESLFHSNKINFYRTALSQYIDQITFFDLEVLGRESLDDKAPSRRGAVVGENVFLSRSPGFHREHFLENLSAVYSSIPLKRDEFNEENLGLIKRYGYSHFSVTAPFKTELKALGCFDEANTVFVGSSEVFSANTDYSALEALSEKVGLQERALIWGAGAMGKALKSILKTRAELLAVRDYQGEELSGHQVLIWCAGPDVSSPKFKKLPRLILDLEYKEQSAAKQVAIKLGTEYISGQEMFEAQAVAQQEFWSKMREEHA